MEMDLTVSDNALNNDTMMEELQQLFEADKNEFNLIYACGWCLLHKMHLAAVKVCWSQTPTCQSLLNYNSFLPQLEVYLQMT